MPSNTSIPLIPRIILAILTAQATSSSLDGTCENGGELTVMFWRHPPYITTSKNGDVCGLFPELLQKMLNKCCNAKVQLLYQHAKGPAEFYTAIEDLKLNRGPVRFDLAMPLHTTMYGKTTFETLPFVAITESLGIAVLKHSNVSSAKLMSSLFQAWPVLIFIIITAAIAGIVMWFVEKESNSKQFSTSFPRGAFDGFWWAFISMTSVGYGDKYPKSLIGRILGSMWIVLGMLFVTMFIGTLTSTLMTLLMEGTYDIQHEKISVVNRSEAHWLGITHHAINIKVVSKQEDLYPPLVHYEVDAALVDINSLKDVVHNLQKNHNIRVSGILPRETFYGIVLRRNSTNMTSCFQAFLEKHEDHIYHELAKYSGTQKNTLDPAEDYFGSGGIFSISVYFMIGVFFTLCISGTIWEFHKHRKMTYLKNDEVDDQEKSCPAEDVSLNDRLKIGPTSTTSTSYEGFSCACHCTDPKTNVEFGTFHRNSKQSNV